MDSKKELESNLENRNNLKVEENPTTDELQFKKESQSDLKKFVTKVDNRVKTKVNFP